jgi:hypothetical protein
MTKQHPPAATPASTATRIALLADWPWSDLSKELRLLFGTNPLVTNRCFVEKRIAHRW